MWLLAVPRFSYITIMIKNMNVKEWIGAILFTIIVMGFLEDAKVTIIILVAFLVILIIIAQIRNMSILR